MTLKKKSPYASPRLTSSCLPFLLAGFLLTIVSCCQRPSGPSTGRSISTVDVTVRYGGPITIKTSGAQFNVLLSGCIKAFLRKDGELLTIDELKPLVVTV
jgi:hypothetical protein